MLHVSKSEKCSYNFYEVRRIANISNFLLKIKKNVYCIQLMIMNNEYTI